MTDLQVHGIVEMADIERKTILILCLRYYTVRNCFIADVTFNINRISQPSNKSHKTNL